MVTRELGLDRGVVEAKEEDRADCERLKREDGEYEPGPGARLVDWLNRADIDSAHPLDFVTELDRVEARAI